MKIYTKTGDKGKTALIGGKRVSKSHIRIDAYGTLDELIAHMAMLRDYLKGGEVKNTLLEIQDRLMSCAAILAADDEATLKKLPSIQDTDILFLEKEIDTMEESLSQLNSFIIPGGDILVSQCHIVRCICRRAERIIIQTSESNYVPETVIRYINRLSDYLFVLARKLGKDLNIPEIPWHPRLDN